MDQSVRTSDFTTLVAANDDGTIEAAVLKLSPADEPWLIELSESDDLDQRWWGIRALARYGTAACATRLADSLENEDATIRAVSVLALAHLFEREPASVQPILPAMAQRLGDKDGSVRQTATDALAQCGDGAVDALASVLEGNNQAARTRATAALRKIGSMKAAGTLFHYLNDTNYLVRSYAYEALDEMGLLETRLLIL